LLVDVALAHKALDHVEAPLGALAGFEEPRGGRDIAWLDECRDGRQGVIADGGEPASIFGKAL